MTKCRLCGFSVIKPLKDSFWLSEVNSENEKKLINLKNISKLGSKLCSFLSLSKLLSNFWMELN